MRAKQEHRNRKHVGMEMMLATKDRDESRMVRALEDRNYPLNHLGILRATEPVPRSFETFMEVWRYYVDGGALARLPWGAVPPPRQIAKQVPRSLRFEILKRDRFRCRYCGADAKQERLEVDHMVPRSKGGTSGPENLVTACRPCNGGKGARHARAVGSMRDLDIGLTLAASLVAA